MKLWNCFENVANLLSLGQNLSFFAMVSRNALFLDWKIRSKKYQFSFELTWIESSNRMWSFDILAGMYLGVLEAKVGLRKKYAWNVSYRVLACAILGQIQTSETIIGICVTNLAYSSSNLFVYFRKIEHMYLLVLQIKTRMDGWLSIFDQIHDKTSIGLFTILQTQ